MKLLNNFKVHLHNLKSVDFLQFKNIKKIHQSAISKQFFEDPKTEPQRWEAVVGLEVHAQIESHTKLFSDAPVGFGSATNTEVSYFDAAFPGTLPVLNKHSVESAVLTSLALNCAVHNFSKFDRKHYFYPDLPAGYQITQQFFPLASDGYIKFAVPSSEYGGKSYHLCSKIKQIQLEQDSGRSIHVKEGKSYVDLNRAGISLMEIVFEPDLKNGTEAAALMRELVLILKRIKTCSCQMEEGTLRVDANISINKENEAVGIRTELKNLNSLRYISTAIDIEIRRQKEVLENGGFIVNETRGFNYQKKETVHLRDKEALQDYRFMPEPNLPPIYIHEFKNSTNESPHVIYLDEIKKRLPVLPEADRQHLLSTYKLSLNEVQRILQSEKSKEIFEYIALKVDDHSCIHEFLFNSVQHQLNVKKLDFLSCPLTSNQIGEIVEMIYTKKISEATANDVLEMLFNGDQRTASEIVDVYNWYQICDGEKLEKLCLQAMNDRPNMVKRFKKTGKYRYMISLLTALNLIVNNRASIQDAENVFQRLMKRKIEVKTRCPKLEDKSAE